MGHKHNELGSGMPPNTHRMAAQDILQRGTEPVRSWPWTNESSCPSMSVLSRLPETAKNSTPTSQQLFNIWSKKNQPVNPLKIQTFITLNYQQYNYTTINLFFVRSLYLQLSHWTRGFRALLKDTRNQLQIHVVGDGLIYQSLLNPGKTITSEKCAQEMKEVQESPMPMAGTGQKKGPMISKTTPHSPLHN